MVATATKAMTNDDPHPPVPSLLPMNKAALGTIFIFVLKVFIVWPPLLQTTKELWRYSAFIFLHKLLNMYSCNVMFMLHMFLYNPTQPFQEKLSCFSWMNIIQMILKDFIDIEGLENGPS